MKIIIGYTLTYTYLISILIIFSSLKSKFSISENITRKLIHIFVGFSWFIMICFFKETWHLIIPPLTFIFINYLSNKKNLIKSMETKNKSSNGTIYYALSFTLLSFITILKPAFLPFYGLGVLSMALGDGIAPFIGSLTTKKIGHTSKTYLGSLSILIITIIITILFNIYYSLNYNITKIFIIGLSATILELLEYKGTDNLTLPLGVSLISYLLAF